MRENSDRNTYDSEARIDELLNSYIDGELTTGQQTEVEDLIARDAGIAQRLRQFQKCKTLLGALPRAEAPPKVLEGIKASLAESTLRAEKSIPAGVMQKKYPRVRRVLAAAAMIGLAAVLTTVLRTMNAPQTPLDSGRTQILAPREFSGRLELKTSDLVAVSASVNKAIESIHLSEAINPARRQDRRIYTLSCCKEELMSLLADLEPMWPVLDSATLSVNTEVFGKQIVVKTVTTEQVAKIIEQDHPGKRVEMAKDFAALNNMASLLPGRAIATAIEGQNEDMIHQWRAPRPILTKPEDPARKTPSQSQDKDKVHLTIVVSW
ncbi:anti-sigma factor family protein [Planctomycetota bacterium]